jgi:hypothetical protein
VVKLIKGFFKKMCMVSKSSRDRLIEEAAEFILAHNGPDEEGRGHHKKKSIACDTLEEAIRLAEAQGLPEGWRPYHFKNTRHVWEDTGYVEEVLVKKVDGLLAESYSGDLFRLITEARSREIRQPLFDAVNRREVKVNMDRVMSNSGNSFFQAILYYIDIKDKQEGSKNCLKERFANLRPYHFFRSGGNIYADPAIVGEVMVKKIDQLLETRFDGDLFELIIGINSDDMESPLIDKLDGREVRVSMGRPLFKCGGSFYDAVSLYVEQKGLGERYGNLRPYHFLRSNPSTFEDPVLVDELVLKKIDQLLDSERYAGNLLKLITESDFDELLGPFVDELDGREVGVSMHSAFRRCDCSVLNMLNRYFRLKDQQDPGTSNLQGRFANLRPYHFMRTRRKTYDDPAFVEEVVVRKLDQLLDQNYGGDLFSMVVGLKCDELQAPFVDELDGQEVKVSTQQALDNVGEGTTRYNVLSHYIQLKGLEHRFGNLRPYHLLTTGTGIYSDPAMVDEVLVKRIDQLLERDYGGDMDALVSNISYKQMITPLVEELDGHRVEVSTAAVCVKHSNSPLSMISRYAELKGGRIEVDGKGRRSIVFGRPA